MAEIDATRADGHSMDQQQKKSKYPHDSSLLCSLALRDPNNMAVTIAC